MATSRILIAGFGGQGVVMMGQLLGFAAVNAGKHATFYPSYGPEQRGGTANCSVVLSDQVIGSPVVSRPDTLICMNATALEKFLPTLEPGGRLFINADQVDEDRITRNDINLICIPIDKMAATLNAARIANMIMLGAVVEKIGMLSIGQVQSTVAVRLAHKPHLLESNLEALLLGVKAAQGAVMV